MVKKAMVMSAGVGSRLEPLTKNVPKPLVPIANVPVMDILLKHIYKNGIEEVIANTYYLAQQIENRYTKNPKTPVKFEYITEKTLSGTAGGVKKCQFFFDKGEDFIVMSADGLTQVDLKEAVIAHKQSKCIATIITKEIARHEVDKFGVIVLDEQNCVKEFQEKPSIQEAKSTLINTGIYIFNYEIFNYIPENKIYDFAKNVFPALLQNGIKINTYNTEKYWSDIGSITQYIESANDILSGSLIIDGIKVEKTSNAIFIKGNNVQIDESATINGNCIIGNNCKLGKKSNITNSILWDNVEIAPDITVENCIIASNSIIQTSISGKIIESNSTITQEIHCTA